MVRRLGKHLANSLGIASVVVLLALLLAALVPQLVAPWNPFTPRPEASLQGPTGQHLLGTDLLGRDVLSQIVYGTRTTMLVGMVAIGLSLAAGVLAGLASGFWGGSLFDEGAMRIMDALHIFPDVILALTIVAILGPERIESVIIALALGRVPGYARLTRGKVLSLRETEFVVAARSVGATAGRILLRHILPQTADVLVVRSVVSLSGVILGEATLSFLGLGVQPPIPSWGRMLREGFQYLSVAPWVALPPGFVIFLTVFALNQVGEAIHDALNPRSTMQRIAA